MWVWLLLLNHELKTGLNGKFYNMSVSITCELLYHVISHIFTIIA